jgi:hypothetical protein
MSNQMRFPNNPNNRTEILLNENLTEINKLASCVDTETNLLKVDIEDATIDATGLATEAKQDDMISLLTGQTPALNRTKAIPVQIMVGDAGDNFDALRASGQDLLVMIDDMNPDVALNSGLARSDKQDTLNASLASVGTDELRVDIVSGTISLPSGASTEAKQDDGITKLTEIDNAIDTTNSYLLTIDSVLNSSLIKQTEIDNAIDAMSAKLPATLGQKANASSLSICRSTTTGAFDLSARTTIATASTSTKLLCDTSGQLNVINNHTWTSLNIMSSQVINGSSSATSSNIDLGATYNHEIDPVLFTYSQTDNRNIEISSEVSLDGTNWFGTWTAGVITTSGNVSFSQEDVGVAIGIRYMRLVVNNTEIDSADTETVSIVAASYR